MEITSAENPTPKRARAARTKKALEETVERVEVVTPSGIKPKAAKRKSKTDVTPALPEATTLSEMIATAAYYLAAQRSFAPGHEMEDWLAAEQQVLGMYR